MAVSGSVACKKSIGTLVVVIGLALDAYNLHVQFSSVRQD